MRRTENSRDALKGCLEDLRVQAMGDPQVVLNAKVGASSN